METAVGTPLVQLMEEAGFSLCLQAISFTHEPRTLVTDPDGSAGSHLLVKDDPESRGNSTG